MTLPQRITSVQQLEQLLSSSTNVLLFKHNTRCPISAGAYREFQQFCHSPEANDLQIGLIYVIEDRPVSNAIAQRFNVVHASPQALLIKDGKVVWNASHSHITASTLKQAKQ